VHKITSLGGHSGFGNGTRAEQGVSVERAGLHVMSPRIKLRFWALVNPSFYINYALLQDPKITLSTASKGTLLLNPSPECSPSYLRM
jgi:hypothetical protein